MEHYSRYLTWSVKNSIDALLIKECRVKGDDPKSSTSPQTMEEALKKYFGLDDEVYLLDKKAR